jgi:hypothetical protein
VRIPRTAPIAIALTIAASTVLGGCSLIPGLGGQSTVEACLQLETGLKDVSSGISDSMSDLVSDPSAAASKIHDVAATFESEAAKISNTEVHDAAVSAAGSISAFSGLIDDYAADPANADTTAISDSATEVQTQMSALGDVCKA